MLSLHRRTGISAEGVIAHKNNQWSLSVFLQRSEGKGGEVTAELIIRGRTSDVVLMVGIGVFLSL